MSAEADDYRTTIRPITPRHTVIALETANYKTNVRNFRRNTAADKEYGWDDLREEQFGQFCQPDLKAPLNNLELSSYFRSIQISHEA